MTAQDANEVRCRINAAVMEITPERLERNTTQIAATFTNK